MPEFRFTSFSDFLLMAGHGIYVWSSVVIALMVFGLLIVHPLLMHKGQIKQLKKRALHNSTQTPDDSL